MFDKIGGLPNAEQMQEWKASQAAKAEADRNRWPTESERRVSLRWTEKFDRPTEQTEGMTALMLPKAQETWDAAEAQRQTHVAAVARLEHDRKARKDAEQAKHDAKRQERIDADDTRLVAELRRRFLSADPTATEADFIAALPEIRRQHRLDAALGRTETPQVRSLVDVRSF